MWRDYVSGYIRNNRSSGMAVILSSFISAVLLSLLCSMFYNMWNYEIEQITIEEGGWHSRIAGEFEESDAALVEQFPGVKEAVLRGAGTGEQSEGELSLHGADGTGEQSEAELSLHGAGIGEQSEEELTLHGAGTGEQSEAELSLRGADKTVEQAGMELTFENMGEVFEDTPRIAAMLEVPEESVTYHYNLLAMYLIRSPQDTAPRMIFPLFLLITALASCSLIIIIHNAFAVTMNARLHQFGIFSSIGATPRQIRGCLLQEAAVLCAAPVLSGSLLGIAGSAGLVHMTNVLLGADIPGRHEETFCYHPLVFLLTLAVTVITIWISAWMPARKLSRLTPLEAIRSSGEVQPGQRKCLWRRRCDTFWNPRGGIEWELARKALRAQKKALRTATLSLLSAFMAFTLMQCFFTMTKISTRETYFERYQDTWDVMVTVREADISAFDQTAEVRGLSGAESAIVYQKAMAERIIAEDELTEEMKAFGGFSRAQGGDVRAVDRAAVNGVVDAADENAGSAVAGENAGSAVDAAGAADTGAGLAQAPDSWLVNAPVIILDDQSFLDYCGQAGVTPGLDGAIIWNQIRDVTNPDFRHPEYVFYIEETGTSVLRQAGNEQSAVQLPVLGYTETLPALREEYATLDYYQLVHFIPVSLWREIQGQVGGAEPDFYICIRSGEHATSAGLKLLQEQVDQLLGGDYAVQSENRLLEYETNEKMLWGMMVILGGFCVLLAVIGVGNIFSNTLGFVRQRRREFARYMSIGLTPEQIRKMFCMEALVLALRPVLITLPPAVAAVGYMLKLSYLGVGEFMAEAPLIPVGIFLLAILGSVALAYYAGWKGVKKIRLAEVLRDDTMM